ncbi:MAG: RDD family protein [SAR86 cluster bacterium]|jgi:uncharacterized RDD family membrane protein YckC|nr:RDD family protein [SAR86 cluster bacterium]
MENASFIRRIFSLLYDSLAILGTIFSLTLLLVVINGGVPEKGSYADYLQLLITILSGPVFYSYFWIVNNGQTLGMQAWKIKLISEEELTLRICLLRCAFSTFSFLILGIGYFYILFNKEKRSLADIATSTRISKIY